MAKKGLNPRLLLHTLAPLRWEQLVYRPIRLTQFRAYRAFPVLAARWASATVSSSSLTSPILATIRGVFDSSFIHLQGLPDKKSLTDLQQNRFTFLNRTLELPIIDWNHRYESHLWNYQFHYFGYVVACAKAFIDRGEVQPIRHCQKLIESWIESARIGRSDGWDAYPISLRVVNWIYAYALLAERYEDESFMQRWRLSIYTQLEFLSGHLEFHLLANHLLKNAKALVIGGLFFAEEKRGQQWLADGERLLWREFEEQVLADGGHYERSPMYHAICLADFLECFALLRAYKAARGISWDAIATREIKSKLQAMTQFLATMSYKDGTLALFNDSGNSPDAHPLLLQEAAARVLEPERKQVASTFPATGYYAWSSPDETERMIVDAGPLAVSYNRAHGHCDLLSYELRFADNPFIVDSGVHGYGGDRFREYCRSTRAHNTVMFDGREQSELWGTFRIGRAAELLSVEIRCDEQRWEFRGSYRPYYERNLIHERYIQRTAQGQWIIEDVAKGAQPRQAQSFIHLHPAVRAKVLSDGQVECVLEQLKIVIKPQRAERTEIVAATESPMQGWYFPDFGIAHPSQTICLTYKVKEDSPFGYTIERCH